MRCHVCDAPAAYAAKSGGIRVGLCEKHLRAHLEKFPGEDLKEQLLSD